MLLLIMLQSASAIRFTYRQLQFGEDWRGAAVYLWSRVGSGDEVVTEPYRRHTLDYYRETRGVNVPPFVSSDSLAVPLPIPLPKNVWYVASVRFNPYWKGDRPGAAETEVQGFLDAHKGSYFAVAPYPESAPVKVWQFTRCGGSP